MRNAGLCHGAFSKAKGSLTDEHISKIRDQFGIKAVSQAKRMLRQQDRHREVMRAVETDEGIDIMHNIPVRLHPDEVEIDDYRETIGNLCEKARTDGVAVSIVDGCFRLVAVNDQNYEKLGKTGTAHLFYHLQFGIRDCTLSAQNTNELHELGKIYPFFDLVQLNLHAMWPPPVFLWLPQDFVLDLLFGRLAVFGQLDYTKLFERARSEGFEMRWIQRKELGELQRLSGMIPGSPNAVGIGVKIADDPLCKEQFILIGYLSRMFLEFMSPSQFLSHSRASPIAETGLVDRNSPRRQLLQQLRYGWCNLTIARDDHCPFKVFSELSRANAPSLQSDRRRLPNLYEGPVPGKS